MEQPHDHTERRGGARRPRSVLRFFGWWFGMFALLGPFSVCPFCGQPGCGGGAVSAGLFGGMIAAAVSVGRWIRHLPHRRASHRETG